MFQQLLRGVACLCFAASLAPTSAHAIWRTLARLSDKKVISTSDTYSYRIRQSNVYSTAAYSTSTTKYYQLNQAGWTWRTNNTGYIQSKFRVNLAELAGLQSEIVDNPQAFVERALKEAKLYPIECNIELMLDSANGYRMEPRITCANVALGSEPAFAWSSPLKGTSMDLQVEY